MLDFSAESCYNANIMKFTLDPKIMGDIHKQFTESESRIGTIQVILEAQLKTRRAVYEIVNKIPGRLGDEVLKHYQGVSNNDRA